MGWRRIIARRRLSLLRKSVSGAIFSKPNWPRFAAMTDHSSAPSATVRPFPAGRTQAAERDDTVEIIRPDQFADRRAETRTECDDRGAMLFLSSQEVITCRILDQSPSGARVSFEAISRLPSEIWLIDLDTHSARRGSAAWSTPNRMGLKFNFVQTLVPGYPRPGRIPEAVFDAWLRLTGQEAPKAGDDGDVLFLD